MSNSPLSPAVSVLSLIDIEELAESYRRKSFGGTEKYQNSMVFNIAYTFNPEWTSWNQNDDRFFLKVKVAVFINNKFSGSRFLWFEVNATSLGIKARCCKQPKLRFGLCSRRFLEANYEKYAKTNSLLPIDPTGKLQLEFSL
jgi:hypothetical protein